MAVKTKKRRKSFIAYMKEHWAGYAMVAPLMIGILIFCYYPPIYGALLAFFDKGAGSSGLGTFFGVGNFIELLKDSIQSIVATNPDAMSARRAVPSFSCFCVYY